MGRTLADRWITHYTRLLAGSMSASQRAYAEQELAYWRSVRAERGADYDSR